ncbi:hypothetical protein Scep_029983 [Stephania cephalantha]|uniref:Uncharacterized protein n=1 Tax=Stephania cephalantha TaxID=152367 RepID=A0AAP0E2B6_9MAGN
MDVVEPHNPIRVLRQMKYIEPYRPIDADRRSVVILYNIKYSYEAQFWEDWERHLEYVERHGEKTKYPYQTTPDSMEWFHKISHPFTVNPKHVLRVVHEDENSLRNRRVLDAALQFRCMDRDNITVADAFDMVVRVIAFVSGADDTYKTTGTATQSKGGTRSTGAACQYGQKGKQPRVKP